MGAPAARKLSAVLHTEVHDLGKTLLVDEGLARDLLDRYSPIHAAAVRKYGGEIIKTLPAGRIARFDNALIAVQCSFAMLASFSNANRGLERSRRIALKCGVGTGDVLTGPNGAYGESLLLASELSARAEPGGLCITREVYSLVQKEIPRSFRALCEIRLRPDSPPVVVLAEEKAATPAAPAPEAHDPGLTLVPAAEAPETDRPENVRPPDPLTDFARAARGRETLSCGAGELPELPPPQDAPIERAVLSIDHRFLMFERVGGMRVLERQLFALRRAGIKKVWLATHALTDKAVSSLRWPPGLDVTWRGKDGDEEDICAPPYANLSGDHLIRIKTLRRIFSTRHEAPTSYQDAANKGVLQIVLAPSRKHVGFDARRMPLGSFVGLTKDAGKGYALRWVLEEARKDADSFMARHFDRNISLAVTRRLLGTNAHPNHMTVLSSLIGIAGALVLAGGTYFFLLAGALVFWLHTVLDGCDGELARLKFLESRRGGVLDFWGDNIVHFLLFSCLGIGLWRTSGDGRMLALGLAAAAASAASAALVYSHSARRQEKSAAPGPFFQGLDDMVPAGGLAGALAKAEHALSQRDFVYLFVFLAAVGKADLFLWASGIGSPLFLAVLIFLRAASKKS